MKPVDKFGRQIYPRPYGRMLANGVVLEREGYRESARKPNLFLRQTENATFFADMRGTEEVPIWEDTSPLFYAEFRDGTPPWRKRRLQDQELGRLEKAGCECRQSYWQTYDNDEEFDEYKKLDLLDQEFIDFYQELPDGYCEVCGKDMQANTFHCSDTCRETARLDQKFLHYYHELPTRRCKVCGKETQVNTFHCSDECLRKAKRRLIESELEHAEKCVECGKRILDAELYADVVNEAPDLAEKVTASPPREHHTSYAKDEKLEVCAKCHAKIHHSKDSPLKPTDKPEDKPRRKRRKLYEVGATGSYAGAVQKTCPRCGKPDTYQSSEIVYAGILKAPLGGKYKGEYEKGVRTWITKCRFCGSQIALSKKSQQKRGLETPLLPVITPQERKYVND